MTKRRPLEGDGIRSIAQMAIMAAFRQFEGWLAGWPDDVLTLALFVAAGLLLYTALRGRTMQKAVALAYVVFP